MVVIGNHARLAYSFASLVKDFPGWEFQEDAGGAITAVPVEGGDAVRADTPQGMWRLLTFITEPRSAGASGG